MHRQISHGLIIGILQSILCISNSFGQSSTETFPGTISVKPEECETPALIVTKSNPDWQALRSTLQRRIFRHWFPPRDAEVCMASFVLESDGTINNLHISRSSGQSMTDKSALEAIMNSRPMPRLPGKIDSAQITIYFDYGFVINKNACMIITEESKKLREKAELAVSNSNYPLAIRLLNQAANIEGPRSEHCKKKLSEAKQAYADSLKSQTLPKH